MEVVDLHEALCKFTQGKEKLDFILSSQRSSLNNGIGFKKDKKPSKGIDHKKKLSNL